MEKYSEDNPPLVQVTPAGEQSTYNSWETDRLLSQYVSINSAEHQEELSTTSSDSGSYLVGVPSSESQQPVYPEKARMVASGTAGAVLGLLLLGGPFFAALVGFGSAYATQKDGPIGDVSRAMGDVALHARDKGLEIDEKHQVVENTKLALAGAWEQAKELDRQHHILDKIKDFLIFSWKEAVDFTLRHRLLERGVEAIGQGLEYTFKRMLGSNALSETQTSPNTSSPDAPARP